jgi:hypothetical protein
MGLEVVGTGGDGLLVESIFGPVRRLHEEGTAAARAAAVKELQKFPPARPPAEGEQMLAEAVRAELPELSASEAAARAKARLGEAVAQRDAQWAEKAAAAVSEAGAAAQPPHEWRPTNWWTAPPAA